MPTRPSQGGSNGTWGTELNAWLDVSINSDGTLKSAAAKAALAGSMVAVFSKTGTLSTGAGVGRFPVPRATSIVGVYAAVGTDPTGASIKCDVNKNGTTVFTTQANRPTIAISAAVSGDAIPDVTSLAAGDLLSVDIDQIGSTIAGSDLTVVVLLA